MSIVLLAILAVMWAAFLLPLIAPGQRRGKRAAAGDGWRPASGPGPGGRRDTPRRLARRRAVLRRRQVLLALSVAVALAVRTRYLLGGRWWIVEAVTGGLLLAYVCALVVQGRRRRRRRRLASRERPDREAAPRERWPFHRRRRRRAELTLWSAPLLEGQTRPE